jgi:hypothetical protein
MLLMFFVYIGSATAGPGITAQTMIWKTDRASHRGRTLPQRVVVPQRWSAGLFETRHSKAEESSEQNLRKVASEADQLLIPTWSGGSCDPHPTKTRSVDDVLVSGQHNWSLVADQTNDRKMDQRHNAGENSSTKVRPWQLVGQRGFHKDRGHGIRERLKKQVKPTQSGLNQTG